MNTTRSKPLDRVLVLEMVRVTEAAAIAASKLTGRGDEKAADAAAGGSGNGRYDGGGIGGGVSFAPSHSVLAGTAARPRRGRSSPL
jgi:fructose-1,6-bisphosphatase II / sedoheptulose-1,7-bisphosphatase